MQAGVIALIVLGLCVVLFLTKWLPACVTGCLGCLLMVLTGVCTYNEAFSGFSSSIVILMFSAMVVGIAMFKTGVAQIIGRTAITLSKGNELRFLIWSCIIGGLLSMFLANTALVAVFIPIIESICETSGTMKRRHLLLPITCAIMLGGSSTLVGCTPQLTSNGILLKMTGTEMTMWSLTAPGLILLAVFILYTALFGYRLGLKIWKDVEEVPMENDRSKVDSILNGKHDKKKLIYMSVILVFMIVFYVWQPIPVAQTAMIAAILCIATGCCSVKDVAREMNWETVIFLASCLGLAEALTVSGAGELIGNFVSSFLNEQTSAFMIFAIIVALTLILSQFITNSTAIIIALPIGISLCEVYGYNYMPFCIGVTLAASIACCTPLAAAQITMTQVAGYEFSDYLKYCGIMSVLMYVVILMTVPLFYPFT